MLSAENGRFPSNRWIARTMNTLFAILADPKFSDDLQAFDDPDTSSPRRLVRSANRPGGNRPACFGVRSNEPCEFVSALHNLRNRDRLRQSGFFHYAKILEMVAAGIQSGAIKVPK